LRCENYEKYFPAQKSKIDFHRKRKKPQIFFIPKRNEKNLFPETFLFSRKTFLCLFGFLEEKS